MIPTVVNIHHCKDWGKPGDICIMRGTPWGNPYKMQHTHDTERKRVIDLYRKYAEGLDITPLLGAIRLGCCCKPKECHGDVLVELIKNKKYGVI
jgi:hypothetical protein